MDKKKSAFSTALKYALITALAMFVFSLVTYLTNVFLNPIVQWLGYVVMLAGLIYTVKDRRDKDLGGYITFGEAFTAGFLFCILVGILGAVSTSLMTQFIAPDMIDQTLKQSEQKMIDRGMSDDQIQLAMSYTRKFMTPVWMAVWVILFTAIVGSILSLIVAAIFRRNNPNLEQPL